MTQGIRPDIPGLYTADPNMPTDIYQKAARPTGEDVESARAELDAIVLHYDEEMNGATRATTALAHATLALVEQQRIANLIAAFQIEGGPFKEVNNWASEEGSASIAILREIREGLGFE